MTKNNHSKMTTTIIAIALITVSMAFMSCKKNHIEKSIPTSVLPEQIANEIKQYMPIYEGTTPPNLNGQFLSKPHVLFHASYNPTEDGTQYYDRYVAFTYSEKNGVDFYGKQWNDSLQNSEGGYGAYYEEQVSKLNITGTGTNFSCYYTTEGYPNSLYAKQSTIFSGSWVDGVGIKDFKVAVVLVETSGNANLEPEGSYRVLGDKDGLAEVNNWMEKSSESTIYESVGGRSDAFFLFRK